MKIEQKSMQSPSKDRKTNFCVHVWGVGVLTVYEVKKETRVDLKYSRSKYRMKPYQKQHKFILPYI